VLFTTLQAQTAQALGAVRWRLLVAAQGLGAGIGNIVCPHNIVAGAATVGLAGREAVIHALRRQAHDLRRLRTGGRSEGLSGGPRTSPAPAPPSRRPLYAKWADAYNKATGARINYQSVGSGAGIRQIKAKTVDFGATDMPLTDDADLAKDGLIQFPTVIGGVVPVVNIKGIAARARSS
jgi:hypothetical protein